MVTNMIRSYQNYHFKKFTHERSYIIYIMMNIKIPVRNVMKTFGVFQILQKQEHFDLLMILRGN